MGFEQFPFKDPTVVTLSDTQTLSNKTLTSPTVNTPTITTPTLTLANTSPTADGGIGWAQATDSLQIGNGSISLPINLGDWQSYTPTLTSWTLGTGGTATGAYARIGKTVFFYATIVFGTSPGKTGLPRISLPPITANTAIPAVIRGVVTDSGTASYSGQAGLYDSGNILPGIYSISGSYVIAAGVQDVTPFTYTVGDGWSYYGYYVAA